VELEPNKNLKHIWHIWPTLHLCNLNTGTEETSRTDTMKTFVKIHYKKNCNTCRDIPCHVHEVENHRDGNHSLVIQKIRANYQAFVLGLPKTFFFSVFIFTDFIYIRKYNSLLI
jgi:hypothetical protein